MAADLADLSGVSTSPFPAMLEDLAGRRVRLRGHFVGALRLESVAAIGPGACLLRVRTDAGTLEETTLTYEDRGNGRVKPVEERAPLVAGGDFFDFMEPGLDSRPPDPAGSRTPRLHDHFNERARPARPPGTRPRPHEPSRKTAARASLPALRLGQSCSSPRSAYRPAVTSVTGLSVSSRSVATTPR